jgi:hypothetical protein
MLDRYQDALADYDRALAVAPTSALACNNRGVALAALNRYREAIDSYDRALALRPDFAAARYNRSLSRLVTGDFARGWEDHDWRWTGSETQGPPRPFAAPLWMGREDIRGKTILLHSEQGIGDTLQFCRYAPMAAARGAHVVLEVHPPLKALLSQLPGVSRVLAMGEPLPPFDCHTPLLSLPRAFETRLENIPADIPYLRAPQGHLDQWRARLGAKTGLRVGLAWSGSRTLKNDRNRTLALAAFAPLRMPGITFVALQKDIRDTDRAALDGDVPILHFEDELADFRDTAALTELMDVVICVDTSIAHLAGAMGKPVWLLLPFAPDWRWLLEREDSPWYPTLRLFRQPTPGDWQPVLDRLKRNLHQ